ncbi:hypothetical protein WD019_21260 [Fictibacillus sp. Mic-4]|uniref:hypothetical protein n=1 Tax=Fictibacillus sp. Mic-4 TaxID=3132826 RepID=UPI003CF5CC84
MKKLLKFVALSSLLGFTLLFSSSFAHAESNGNEKYVNNNGVEITQQDFKRLQNLGFSEDEIQQMDADEFNNNKDLTGVEISSDTKYYEVSEKSESQNFSKQKVTNVVELSKAEYYKRVKEKKKQQDNPGTVAYANPDTGSTSYKTMTTQIISLGSREYRIKNSVQWDVLPKTRSYDVIGAAVNSSQFAPNKGTEYAKQYWSKVDYTNHTSYSDSATYSSSSDHWEYSSSGYGLKMNLPNDNWSITGGGTLIGTKVTDIHMYAYYTVEELKYGTQDRIDAYGRYAHAEENISFSFGASMTLGGIGISFSGVSSESFSVQRNTQATLYI